MKDYSAMSDDEIAMEIFLLNLCESARKLAISRGMNHHDILRGAGEWSKYDPCNNPADAWPIIASSGISLMFDGEWQACANIEMDSGGLCSWDYYTLDSNPLRAAMIVYLKMMEQKS